MKGKNKLRMTNGDKIRQMSDEEIMLFINDIEEVCSCPPQPFLCRKDEIPCNDCWLKWLKSEVEE